MIDVAAATALLTASLIVALVLRPGAWQLALDAWVLALGLVALGGAVGATHSALPAPGRSPLDAGRRPRRETPTQLAELARVEREVALGAGTAFDAHYRLRPLLRDVAEHRLATRRGLVLDKGGEAVVAALGEATWELVRPDRERPKDHFDRGPSLADVRAAIDALERI